MKKIFKLTTSILYLVVLTMILAGCSLGGGDGVQSVSITPSSVKLKQDQKYQLSATMYPSNVADAELAYKSSDEDIVSVDETTGRITANEEGSAIITVYVVGQESVKDTCEVTVSNEVADTVDIKLNTSNVKINVGETYNLKYTLTPKNVSDYSIQYESEDESVATVDDNGHVRGVGAGTTTVTVRETVHGVEASATVTVVRQSSGTSNVAVSGVSLNKTSLKLNVNDTFELKATVSPSNASNKTISWESSNTSIVSVDGKGKIYAHKAGTATITVKTNNGKSATCTVKVSNVSAGKITLDKTKATMRVGKTLTLKATITPANTTDKKVTWKSSDKKIATVSSSGKITAKNTGKVTITATTSNGKKATCTVTVKAAVAPTGVKLNKTKATVEAGKSITLKATVEPSNATNKNVTWKTSDKTIATVDSKGKVITFKTGTVKITAKTSNGKKATCTITVKSKIAVSSIELSSTKKTIQVGKTAKLTVKIKPSNASNQTIQWTSSNTSVAVVNASGEITAIKEGTAKITAKSNNGKTATCTVTVKTTVPVSSVTLSSTKKTIQVGKTASLTATIKPSNATNKKVTWTSSNTGVATVDSNGKVTAKKEGTATITVKSTNGKKATCTVTVKKKIPISSISLDKTKATIKVGKTLTLKATIKPSNATVKAITWKSTNTSVITVSSSGKVTAKKAGKARIMAIAAGGKTAECVITVKK